MTSSSKAPQTPPEKRPELDETPPILGTWSNIYLVVLGVLLLQVVLFALLTRIYAP